MSINNAYFTGKEIDMIRHSIMAHIKQCEEQMEFLKSFGGYDLLGTIDYMDFKIKKLMNIYNELDGC